MNNLSTKRFGPASFALRESVFFNLLFLVLIFAGILVVGVIPVDVYPDVELDEASVDTFWPGASAEDVERLVTGRIEAKIQDIKGVTRIISDSKPDASLIRVKFRESLSQTQLDAAFRQLRSSVERVTDLPADAEKPLITRFSLSDVFPLLWVVVEDVDGVGEEVIHDIVLKVKRVLRDVPGVAKVDDKLIRSRELHLPVDRTRLREADLTLGDVAGVLKLYNRNVPSGVLPQDRGEIAIRAVGESATPEQLGDIAVRKHAGGSHVYLRDIATPAVGFERETFSARFNGHQCKPLSVSKTDEADSRLVADRINAAIAEFQKELPPGVEVGTCLDSSQIIRSRLRVLSTNLVTGIILVFLVLWMVMGIRNSLLAIIGIPFSFLFAIIFMHLMGVTISAVSLFALVLCSGMIVDDAIVVLENIYRHIEVQRARADDESGEFSLRSAIILGTEEVMWPVIASSATTVVAFLPLLMMPGVSGKFFSVIPKTVAVVLLASLFECLLMVPVHYLSFGPRSGVRPIWSRFRRSRSTDTSTTTDNSTTTGGSTTEEPPPGLLLGLYARLVTGALRHRYVAALPMLAFGVVAYCIVPLMKVDLFPSDYGLAFVDIQAWEGASLDHLGEVMKPIEEIVLALQPEYVASVLTAGGLVATEENTALWRVNLGQFHVQLADTPEVNADPDIVATKLTTAIQKYVDEHPDSGIEGFKVWARQDGPPIGNPVAVRIECPDLSMAKQWAGQFKSRLEHMPGVFGVTDNLEFGSSQINLRLREDVASTHGLTQPDLAMALRTANDGLIVTSFKDKTSGEDLDVRLMFDAKDRQNLNDLLDIRIRTPRGYVVRIGDVCDMDMSQGYAGIPHFDGKRVISVTAQVNPDITSANAVNETLLSEFGPRLRGQSSVRVTYGGEFEETVRSFDSLKQAYLLAMVLIYMLLATQFRSYTQPFVIICTVPFSCIGVIGGLWLGGYPFTIMTFIAIVGLTGVVVNDSIVLLDFVNQQRAKGLEVAEALKTACRLRVRPVLLTTITTVLGLLPLAMGWGGKSKIWSPFAASFALGLVCSTVITLVVVPALYYVAEDIVTRFRRKEDAR